MAITIPVIFTEVFKEEVKYTHSVTEETVRKMIQNVNMQGKFAPVGTIRFHQLNQIGAQAVNSDIWMFCDGAEITNPNSPLRSVGLINRFTPDLKGRFIAGATSTNNNPFGGNATVNLLHNHGGQTGITGNQVRGEEGEEKTASVPHSHPIIDGLYVDVPLEPACQVLAYYIKVT